MFLSAKNNKYIEQQKSLVNILINNEKLKITTEYCYLGLILDDKLTFVKHIKMIKKRIAYRHYILKKIRWCISFSDAVTVFKSMILPMLDIGDIYYQSANKDILNSLQSLQNKCLRTIYYNKKWPGTLEAHKNINIFMTDSRRKLNLLKNAHTDSYKPSNIKEIAPRTLRSNRRVLLKTEMAKIKLYEKSHIYRSRKIWNQLSEEIKHIRDISKFKLRIKSEMKLNNLNFPE